MDDREYHALPRLSASGAKTLLKSPARYHHERQHPARPTAAMEFGTMFHALVLEPAVFANRYVIGLQVDRRTNAGKAAWEQWQADNQGKHAVSPEEWDRVHAMARAVERSGAGDLMTGGVMDRTASDGSIPAMWAPPVAASRTIDAATANLSLWRFPFVAWVREGKSITFRPISTAAGGCFSSPSVEGKASDARTVLADGGSAAVL